MSNIPLNKFEKHDLVIRLLEEGKTYREICHIAHVSPRDIKKIIQAYDKKVRLESKRETQEGNTQRPKKLSLSSQAFTLFKEGKKLDEVKVLLDIPFKKAKTFWKQYLESIKMEDCYQFYEMFQNDLHTLLPISSFMKRNNVSGIDILNVLRTATDVNNLKQTYSNIKNEVEKLKQIKNNLQYSQNKHYAPLKPLPKPVNWIY